MDLLFPAIERHFKGSSSLVRFSRRMYEGFAGAKVKGVLPYVECHSIDATPIDTFGKDIVIHSIQFSLFAKQIDSTRARQMRRAFIERFDDCDLPSARFKTVSVQRVSGSGPTIVEEVWQSVLFYDITIQLVELSPVVRIR